MSPVKTNYMHDYKKLRVWNASMELAKETYQLTDSFPRLEIFGLTNQLRRCSVSIPSNIAEGSGRSTTKDFKYFLHIAYGSTCELETQLILAKELSYQNESDSIRLLAKENDVQKMLFGLIGSNK